MVRLSRGRPYENLFFDLDLSHPDRRCRDFSIVLQYNYVYICKWILHVFLEDSAEDEDKSEEEAPEPEMPFKEEWEQISEKTRAKLQARGVVQLFPVQAKTYKACYEGKDLIVKSRTGSGKTFAFGIPIVEKLQSDQVFTKEKLCQAFEGGIFT